MYRTVYVNTNWLFSAHEGEKCKFDCQKYQWETCSNYKVYILPLKTNNAILKNTSYHMNCFLAILVSPCLAQPSHERIRQHCGLKLYSDGSLCNQQVSTFKMKDVQHIFTITLHITVPQLHSTICSQLYYHHVELFCKKWQCLLDSFVTRYRKIYSEKE